MNDIEKQERILLFECLHMIIELILKSLKDLQRSKGDNLAVVYSGMNFFAAQ